jgi:hypothetical protein
MYIHWHNKYISNLHGFYNDQQSMIYWAGGTHPLPNDHNSHIFPSVVFVRIKTDKAVEILEYYQTSFLSWSIYSKENLRASRHVSEWLMFNAITWLLFQMDHGKKRNISILVFSLYSTNMLNFIFIVPAHWMDMSLHSVTLSWAMIHLKK